MQKKSFLKAETFIFIETFHIMKSSIKKMCTARFIILLLTSNGIAALKCAKGITSEDLHDDRIEKDVACEGKNVKCARLYTNHVQKGK